MEISRDIASNKKAFYDYFIIDKYEAGIALQGTEIKAIRAGRINLKNSYVMIDKGEAILEACHISEYEHGSFSNHDPLRPRKLLLHKREIMKLLGAVQEKGYSIVPLRVYFVKNKLKVEIALVQGKKKWDKREDIAKKDAQRRISQALSPKNQG